MYIKTSLHIKNIKDRYTKKSHKLIILATTKTFICTLS